MDRLLLAIDFSPRSDRALRKAALIADKSGAALTLLHVIDESRLDYPADRREETASVLLEDAVKTIRRFDRIAAEMKIVTGDVSSSIARVADETDADMIIMGSHRRTFKDVFVGTTAERTIERSRRPVLIANGMPSGVYERVFFALDFDDVSRSAVRIAQGLGIADGTTVTAMHAFDAPALPMMKRAMETQDVMDHYVAGEEQRSSLALDAFLTELDLRPDRRVLRPIQGSLSRAILDCAEAEGAELIIVGDNGRKGAERLLMRSVAMEILKEADRDILVVPAAGFSEQSLHQ